MKIESRAIDDIKPYERNPRNNDPAVDAVAKSLKEFGWRQPIVVDKEGVIVVGHTRLKAAQKLGLAKVPVHVASDLTPEQARAYRIADNQTASIAEWDMELLPLELTEIKDLGFDMTLLGFDEDELSRLLKAQMNSGLVDPDDIPAPPAQAVTQPGDLWRLGNHRLLCGDSGKAEDVDRLLDGAPIHIVSSDPPYGVRVEPRSNNAIAAGLSSFQGTHHQKLDVARHPEKAKGTSKRMRAKDRPLANDFVTDEEFLKLLDAWFGNISRVLLPGRAFYIWGGYANVGNYPPVLKRHGLYFSQAIIWHKLHPVLTRKDFMGDHEWCQPAGTQVLTPDGTVPIETLKDGDRVVSFSSHSSAVVGFKNGFEVQRTVREYQGTLHGVAVGDRTTWCTDGHPWTVRLLPEAGWTWCVYLMRRGNWWRVGKSRLMTTAGFGLKHRLRSEGGDEAWILSTHRSNFDALAAEQRIVSLYGIPSIYWEPTPSRTSEMIAGLYAQLDSNELTKSAFNAIRDHGRNPTFPFAAKATAREKFGRRIPLIVRACNLLPEVMAIPVPTARQQPNFEWSPVRVIDHQPFQGPVYSMEVDKHHHYIADGLVTHNCFYGWKEGAAHQFLGPNNIPDVWPVKKINPQSMVHLTEKPVELAARALSYSSKPGENVMDLFGGSGSTLMAAEQLGRTAYLMELDAPYCDVILTRWAAFTGESPVNEHTGEKFAPRKMESDTRAENNEGGAGREGH